MSEQDSVLQLLAGTDDYLELGYRLLGERRRASPRFKLDLPALCLLADGCQAQAVIRDASCGGLAVECYRSGAMGEPVVVDIERLDRFDGRMVRRLPTGFAVELRMTPYRRKTLRKKPELLAGGGGQDKDQSAQSSS